MNKVITFAIVATLAGFFLCCKENEEARLKRESDTNYLRFDGRSFLENGKLDKAEEAYLMLLKLAPDDPSVYANLALVYLKLQKYDEAKKMIHKALKIAPENPEIRFISAKYYEVTQQIDKAIRELEKIIEQDSNYITALYNLARMYEQSAGPDAVANREKYLKLTVEKAMGNIVPRLDLMAILLKKGEYDEVLLHLENLNKIFPEFPKEAIVYYNKAMEAFHAQDMATATSAVIMLQNFLIVTRQYQSDLRALKGSHGDEAGSAIVSNSNADGMYSRSGESILHRIRFLDMTDKLELNISMDANEGPTQEGITTRPFALGDFNNDGYVDVYCGGGSVQDPSPAARLLMNNAGNIFVDQVKESGISHSGQEAAALFGDYNNDGFLDLYVVKDSPNILYKNDGKGMFSNVGVEAKVADPENGKKVLYLDADHDGDLDLLITKSSSTILYRNNSDGTFSDMAASMGLGLPIKNCNDAAFADFDEDGDLDIFLTNDESPNLLFSNNRGGRFTNVTSGSGLQDAKSTVAVAAADYDNNGFTDLLLLSKAPGMSGLYTNNTDGTFKPDPAPWMAALRGLACKDAVFIDFDNDSFLDLFIVGNPIVRGEKGLLLFHNDAKGGFEDVSDLIPSSVAAGQQIETADYDKDGDLDIFIADLSGKLHLLQNEGGNLNHYLDLQLVGLRNGNSKNNHFGIGAKVEIRARDIYQMKVVTEPNIHFGLGAIPKADVLRVIWTNGVAQNTYFPSNDNDLLEIQALKGSCAFLYTWDGERYVFCKDMMWRSALGMPLGIMGANTAYAPADPSREYLKIPGEQMKLKDGKYIIQITEELWETAYFDNLRLVVIEHPEMEEIFVDERFTLPPYTDTYDLYAVQKKMYPVSAVDDAGTNLLQQITRKDDYYITNFQLSDYQGITEIRDLVLDPGKTIPSGDVMLYLNGWIFPSDASINVSLSQSSVLEVVPPQLQVVDKNGAWVTVIQNMGFPMGKDKLMIVDLSGKFLSKDHRVRIRTNMEIYWDEIFFAPKAKPIAMTATVLRLTSADLHYRGFSQLYRKGGRYGPHWFDYNEVSKAPKWRDLIGDYTRFGEVAPLLTAVDDKLVIMNSGDEMTVYFDAGTLPPLQAGRKRDFLIYSEGWIKDGDLNTAHGKTVNPLPFHAMTKYPYADDEFFPTDAEHLDYIRQYNTRKVNTREFQREVIDFKDVNQAGGR